ncbi:MAG: hypothetical protein Q9218_001690 [Villophora microphyllina]
MRADHTSAKVPSIKTRHGPPKKPAKNRQTARAPKLFENPAPRMKRAKIEIPNRLSERPKTATVIETLKFIITPWIPTVREVTPKALCSGQLAIYYEILGQTHTPKANAVATMEA